MKFWNLKKPYFLRSYLRKYGTTRSENRTRGSTRFLFKWVLFLSSETLQTKVIVKMPRWPVWSSETLESKALIPNVKKTAHEKIEKIDQRLRNKPLRGGPTSFTLHKWTILIWYKWQDLFSIYRSLRDHNIISADITIIM